MSELKREVPFIIMIIMIIARWAFEWIGPVEALLVPGTTLKVRALISYAMTYMGIGAFLMGILNFSRVHVGNISRRREHWIYSAWALICAWGYAAYGVWKSNKDPLYDSIYQVVFTTLDATMYSLLAFYIASAAYRAFRLRNVEATLMMGIALVVMLANVPLGEFVWSSSGPLGGFVGLRDWVMQTPTAAVGRAISLGIVFGQIASSWRVILGIERRHLGQ